MHWQKQQLVKRFCFFGYTTTLAPPIAIHNTHNDRVRIQVQVQKSHRYHGIVVYKAPSVAMYFLHTISDNATRRGRSRSFLSVRYP